MDETFTLEDMIAQFGGNQTPTEPANTDPNPNPNPEPTPPVANPQPVVTAPVVQEPSQPQDPTQQQQPTEPQNLDKTQQAFIHMRQQNKQYADTLKGIAKVLNVQGDLSDDNNIIAALQTKITETEASRNNVPVELYQRLQQLEQTNQQYTAQQTQQRIATGFEMVKNQFNLSQQELNTFAEDLVKQGRNPFEMQLDLTAEYRNMYFDQLMQKAINTAVANEQARSAKATNQSTTPANQNGNAPDTGDQKVNSVRELQNWFSQHVG